LGADSHDLLHELAESAALTLRLRSCTSASKIGVSRSLIQQPPLCACCRQRRCFGCWQPPPRAVRRTPALTTAQPWFRRSAGNTPPRRRGCRLIRCTLNACMRGATECRVSRRRLIPLVIRASCRALRLIMGAPKARDREDADCRRLMLPVHSEVPATRSPRRPRTDSRGLPSIPFGC
jgi:hypothetical protein